MPGRINRGRGPLRQAIGCNDAFGSINIFPHTSICELSIFMNTSEMTRDLAKGSGKNHFKADFLNSEFVIFWGTGFAEANFGLTPMAELVTVARDRRGTEDRRGGPATQQERRQGLAVAADQAWRPMPRSRWA